MKSMRFLLALLGIRTDPKVRYITTIYFGNNKSTIGDYK